MKQNLLLLRISLLLSAFSVVAFVVPKHALFSSPRTTCSVKEKTRTAKDAHFWLVAYSTPPGDIIRSCSVIHTPPAWSVALTATQIREDLYIDEDDHYYEPCNKTFADFHEELEALAFLSSVDRTAASKAQQVFDAMYEAHILENDPSLWPNVTIYNLFIDAYAWSKSPSGGKDAQLILDRMQDDSVEEIARPNVDTYIKTMEAWASRKQPERAEQVFRKLQQRYESTKSDDVRPNTGAYNKLIKAYMRGASDDSSLPQKAEALLLKMMEEYENGNEFVKPNRKSWIQVMNAYSSHPSVESVEKITELIQRMARWFRIQGDEDCQPNTQCYNVLIKTTGQVPSMQEQTQEILYDMMESYENGNQALRPNGATFVNVYNSFRSTDDPDSAADTVVNILEQQESISEGENNDIKPDVRAYNAVLAVMARGNDPIKAARSKEILERMKVLRDKGDKSVAPNLRTYNNILNACAYTRGSKPKELMTAFRVAVDCINDLRESPLLQPDPVSYGLFLRSCHQLMPPSDKREAVVENIFRKCCQDGQLGQFVLYELSQAASPRLCRKLLGGDMDEGVELPSEWSRNVKNQRQRVR